MQTIVDLWRAWTWLEDEYLASPQVVDGSPGAPDHAEQERQEALCFEIQTLRDLVCGREICSFEDIAVTLDLMLEYDITTHRHPDDRKMLHHLIDGIERLAPTVKIGAIRRHVAYGSIEGGSHRRE